MRKNNDTAVAINSTFGKLTRMMAMFTASLFLVSSTAAYAAPDGMSGREFRAANADMSRQDFREFRREMRDEAREARIQVQQRVTPIPNPVLAPVPVSAATQVRRADLNREVKQHARTARLQQNHVTQEYAGQVIKLDNGANLDLTSSVRNITIGDKLLANGATVDIKVGGEKKTVSAGTQLTAAEYVAVKQALGGSQSLKVGDNGAATGGTVDLNSIAARKNTMTANGVTVASGVTAVGDLSKGSSFKLDGDLNNFGSVVAVATTGGRHAGDITAENITNNEGALISSDAGNKFGNKASAIDLTLNANNNFTNNGTIVSSGDLNINAGGSLSNSGSTSANDNVSLNSASIKNSGLVSSTKGDITVDSPAATVLNVDNAGGTMQANNGAINVRAASNTAALDTNFTGGNLYSKAVNLQTGVGMTELHVNDMTGTVNGAGTGAHVSADTAVLNLGEVCFDGDPTFKNSGGDINFTGNLTVNQALAVIASGDITVDTGANVTVTARTGGGTGQLITFAAGYDVTAGDNTTGTLPPGTAATIPITASSGGLANGGSIDLANAASFNFATNGVGGGLGGNAGGGVNLFALQVAGNGGDILLPTASTINTSGSGATANSGNVTIVAPGTISLGSIDANGGGLSGGGDIVVRNVNPTGSTTFAVNGTISAGGFATAGPATSGSINFNAGSNIESRGNTTIDSFGTITANGGSTIDAVNGALSVTTTAIGSSITTSGASINWGAAGDVNLTTSAINTTGAGAGGAVTILADNNDNGSGNLNGTGVAINTSGTAGGAGGVITLDSGENGGQVLNIGALTSAGDGAGAGGNINIGTVNASAGDVTIGGAVNAGTGAFTVDGDDNDHDLTLGGDVNASAFNVDLDTGNIIGPAGGITITTNGYTVTAGSFTAGGNPITIQEQTAGTTIGLAGGAGTLNISGGELADFVTSSLQIGSIGQGSGTVTTGGAINLGTLNYDLNVFTGGNYAGGANNITLGSRSVNIDATGSINSGNFNGGTGAAAVSLNSDTSNVLVGNITNQTGTINIDAATDVTVGAISTTDGIVDVDAVAGAVTVTSITKTGANDINLDAGTNVSVGGATSSTGGGNVIYSALTGLINTGDITTTTGNITLTNAPGGTSVSTGALQTSGGNVDIDSGTTTTVASIAATSGGTIDIDAGGNVQITGDVTGTATSLTIDNTASGGIQTGNITTAGLVDLGDATNNTGISTLGINSGAGAILLDSAGQILVTNLTSTSTITATAGTDVITDDVSGDLGITFTSGTGFIDTDDLVSTTGNIILDSSLGTSIATLSVTTTGGNVDFDAGTSIFVNGNITFNNGGSLALDAGTTVTVTGNVVGSATDVSANGTALSFGNITTNNGNIVLTGTTGAVSTGDLSAGTGNVDILANGGNATTGTITNTGIIDIDALNDISLGAITNAVGVITVDAGGSVLISAPISGGVGNVTLTALGGDMNIGDVTTTTGNLTTVAFDDTTTGNLSSTDGNIDITSGGDINILSVTITGTGLFTSDAGGNTTVGPINVNTDVLIESGGDINVGAITTAADIFLYAGNDIFTAGTLTADPIVMTAGSDINLGGDLVADGGITVVAGERINGSTAITIDGSGATNGGNVTLVAGADFSVVPMTSVTINGASATGGTIDFSSGLNIDTTGAAGNGGNVELVAYQNNFANGQIFLPFASSITTTGSGTNISGSVTAVAGALSGVAINLGNITTNTATNGIAGVVELRAATPNSGITIGNDATPSGIFYSNDINAADIRTNNITSRGGFVGIVTNQNAGTGNINVSGQSVGAGHAGTVIVTTTGTDRMDIGSVAGQNYIQSISAVGGSANGNGGLIIVDNNGTTGIRTGALNVNATANGNGGAIFLDADQGDLQLVGLLTANGAGVNANGGSISLTAATLTPTAGGLQALATGTGAGGSISVTLSTGGLTLGTGGGQLQIATSGVGDSVAISTGANLTVAASGAFSADAVLLQTTNGGNITINGAVEGEQILTLNSSAAVQLNAATDSDVNVVVLAIGNISGGGLITAPQVTLGSQNGNIGVSTASRINIDADNLNVNAPGGSVFINDVDDLNINLVSNAALTFDVQAQGALTNTGAISAQDVVLRSVTSSVTPAALVSGTNSVTLRSFTDIVNTGINNVVSTQINLISDFGNIGTFVNPLSLDAVNLTANAFGDVYIIDSNDVNINGASSAGGLFALEAPGTISSSATISGNDVILDSNAEQVLLGAAVNATDELVINQAFSFTNANFTALNAPQIVINVLAGNIGTSPANRLILDANNIALNASGNVYYTDPNSVNIGVSTTSSAGLVFDVISGGNLVVRNDISAGSVILTAANDIELRADITATVGTSLTAGNNVQQTVLTADIITPLLDIEADGTVTIMNTTNNGGNQIIQFTGSGLVNLTTQETGDVTLAQSTASELVINATASNGVDTFGDTTVVGLLNISTSDTFTNEFNLSAGTVSIQSSAGNPLTFNGGTGSGSITATGPSGTSITAAAGNLTFTGDQNFFGDAEFLVQPFNTIVIALGANIIGADTVTLSTCNLDLQGNLQGNPIIFNCPLGAGTIANSTGDVNLASDLVFNGLDLAIIASGSINTTGLSNITLNSTTGNGGSLTLLAGFDFTPATAGQVGPDQVLYTISGPSATGGNINLQGTTIDTSTTFGGAAAGSVFASASAGTGAAGDAALGLVIAQATGATGNGGALQVIAAGDVSTGLVNLTGSSNDGTVSLVVSQPQVVGVVQIGNGELLGPGTITGSGPTGVGSITVGPLTVGDASFTGANSVDFLGNFTGTGDLTVETVVLNVNGNTVSADNIFTQTPLAGADFVVNGGGGTLTATAGTIELGDGTNTENVIFNGGLTFNGVTNINPGVGFAVVVGNTANVVGNDAVNLNTCNLILQGNGFINGDPLNFNCPNGAGTIANSSGDVDLTGISLVFSGQSLAILASGDIIAGTTTLIDLSSATGDGGSLLAVAGFDFTPATVGQTTLPNPTVYRLASPATPSTTGGDIDFTGLNIITSATGATGDGGSITLVARGGNVNDGDIDVGNITTTSANGFGGDVLIIAEGGFNTGTFATTGALGNGVVTTAAAQAQVTGGDILVLNGEQGSNGFFTFGPATGAGTIANSNGDVDLTGLTLNFTGLDLAIIASGDVIAGDVTQINLSDGAGDSGSLLVVAGFDFTPLTGTQVNFNSGTTYTFTAASTSGGNIEFAGVDINADGGAGNGGNVTLVASAGTLSNGVIEVDQISATGSVNGGNVTIIAEGGFTIGGVNVDGGTGTDGIVNLAAATPVITGGPITVNNGTQGGTGAFTFTTPTGVGTIANSTGDVTLSGTLNFFGQNLAILAANDILAGSVTSINLSNLAGAAGSLTMIAGFDFTPATPGQVVDSSTTFIIGSASADGGNINLGTTDIFLNGSTNGGNLTAVAIGGAISDGNISLGDIDTSGTDPGNNGNILVIANNNIDTGVIDASGGASATGNVTLASAIPVLTGVEVTNGSVTAGTITVGSTIGSGTIDFDGIGAGGDVSISTNTATLTIASSINAGGDIDISNATGTVAVNGNLLSTAGNIAITSTGLTTVGTIDADDDLTLTGNGAAITIGGAMVAGGTIDIDGYTNFTNNATITSFSDVLVDVNGNLIVNEDINADGVISLNLNDTAGVANLLTISANLTAVNQIDIVNNGTDKKIDILTLSPNVTIQTAKLTPGNGDVNIRMGAVSDPRNNNNLPKSRFLVTETGGGTLNLFGRTIRGEKPVNNINAQGANVNITLQKGFQNKQLLFGGGVTVTADPPVAAGSAVYVNGRLVGAEDATASIPSITQEILTAPLAPVATDSYLVTANITTGDTVANNLLSLNAQTLNNDQRTSTLYGAVSNQEDNSYVVGGYGPTSAADASICSDTEIGVGNGNGIARMPHSNKVVLKKGNVLFVPFVDTVVVTPHGTVNVAAKSVAMISATDNELAVYDLDDNHKGAVTIEAHGQKLSLAPGSHVTLADERSEFAQVNVIEAIPHRNVASRVIRTGIKAHTSEFAIHSAIQTIKPLKSVMSSSHPQAKKLADRLTKTSAVVLHLGGNGEYQHHFKPAMTAMAK